MKTAASFVSLFIAFAILNFAPNLASAADGSSGCGPGWYLFKNNSIVSSALRATTNGLLFPVTTIGMTFGTSNCSRHDIVLKEKESLHFVTHNYFELKGEVAKGNGTYLQAYAHTLGCNPASQPLFNERMKARYKEVFDRPGIDPNKALLETYITIFSDAELVRECTAAV